MTTASEYNARALATGDLTGEMLAELVRAYQEAHGLLPDGKAGPITRAVLAQALRNRQPADELVVVDGWLKGPGAEIITADPSWYGGPMPQGPLAIVAHYTATDPGTALAIVGRRYLGASEIARRLLRAKSFECELPNGKAITIASVPRAASWHVTIAQDGTVFQGVPLTAMAWHVAAPTRLNVPGGLRANACAIGIELEGHGDVFPPAQVEAARRVWRALVRAYSIPRELAMLAHSDLQDNRSDPGPEWMGRHAGIVLEHAFT